MIYNNQKIFFKNMASEGYVKKNFSKLILIFLFFNRKFPPIKWAQTDGAILMTIDVADCENIVVDVNEADSKLIFR